MDDKRFAIPTRSVRQILAGLVVMVAGYILMCGGGSSDPNVFNESMFNFTRTVASPLLILLGIAVIIIAIMRKPGDGQTEEK